jgi:hypothetical protein
MDISREILEYRTNRFHFPSFSVLLKHGDAVPQQVADDFGGFPLVPRERREIRSHESNNRIKNRVVNDKTNRRTA